MIVDFWKGYIKNCRKTKYGFSFSLSYHPLIHRRFFCNDAKFFEKTRSKKHVYVEGRCFNKTMPDGTVLESVHSNKVYVTNIEEDELESKSLFLLKTVDIIKTGTPHDLKDFFNKNKGWASNVYVNFIHTAINFQKFDIIKLLVDYNYSVEYIIRKASELDSIETLKYAITELHGDLNTCLEYSVYYHNIKSVKYLNKIGADIKTDAIVRAAFRWVLYEPYLYPKILKKIISMIKTVIFIAENGGNLEIIRRMLNEVNKRLNVSEYKDMLLDAPAEKEELVCFLNSVLISIM